MTGDPGRRGFVPADVDEVTRRLRAWRDAAVAVLFGDSVGLTLYLGFLLFFVLVWRTGTFFNDIELFVRALERLAAGHLSLGPPDTLEHFEPGMHLVDGEIYARNYGEVALAVPVFWLLELVGPVAVRALAVVGWSVLAVVVTVRVADRYGRRRLGLGLGSTVALVALLANALTFRPFVDGQVAVVALQVTTMLVAGFTGVLVYRLVARRTDTRVAVIAGAATVFATPVGFWATVPKRHAFAATLVVAALYGLARSREDPVDSTLIGGAGFRGLAYASAGLLTWIHAPEGFTLFLAVAAVDLPTAPRNDGRALAVVAAVFAVSLLPFLLTNYLVSGAPLEPPRFLPAFEGVDATPAGGGGGDGGGGGGSGGGATAGVVETLVPSRFSELLRRGLSHYREGVVLMVTDPGRLATVFLRWGRHGFDPRNQFFGNGTNLAVVEAAPVIAALAVAPVREAVERTRGRTGLPSLDPTDAFVAVFSVLLVALYLDRLPIRVQVTVRYLHPLYPLFVYALFRQAWLQDVLDAHAGDTLQGYGAVVLVGVPSSVGLLLLVQVGKGPFVQVFGLVSLLAAGALAASSLAFVIAGRDSRRRARATAFSFGVAGGVATAFVLLTSFVLMHYGPSTLPFVDAVTADVRFAVIRFG